MTEEKTRLLSPEHCIDLLNQLVPKWEIRENQEITRDFMFDNFNQNIKFVNEIADIADKHNHHPELHVSYNRCKVFLTTHDAGGLTKKDFEMAGEIDRL